MQQISPHPSKPASESRAGAMGLTDFWTLLKDSALAWNTDGAASMGAAIAFYTIFSIAPY